MARVACLASVSLLSRGRGSPREVFDRNVSAALKLAGEAALDEPDVICLPEAFPTAGLPLREAVKLAEPIPNSVIEAFGGLAEEHWTYVVCPMLTAEGGSIYNSAVLIGRDGGVVGVYHKVYPTISEIEAGVRPGEAPVTFETDLGRVGMAICFDLNFDDVFEAYRRERVKVVFFPSAYPGGLQVLMRAHQCACYFVTALLREGSMIVDPLGRVLAVSSDYSPVISVRVNLDFEVLHLDYNVAKVKRAKERYGARIAVEVSGPEGVMMLTSHSDEVSALDVVREFGMELRDEYFERSREARASALSER